jgi:hypothetical protein
MGSSEVPARFVGGAYPFQCPLWVESRRYRSFAVTPRASVRTTILIQPGRSGVWGHTRKLPHRSRLNDGFISQTLAGKTSAPSAAPERSTTPSNRLVPFGQTRKVGVPLYVERRPSTHRQAAVGADVAGGEFPTRKTAKRGAKIVLIRRDYRCCQCPQWVESRHSPEDSCRPCQSC